MSLLLETDFDQLRATEYGRLDATGLADFDIRFPTIAAILDDD